MTVRRNLVLQDGVFSAGFPHNADFSRHLASYRLAAQVPFARTPAISSGRLATPAEASGRADAHDAQVAGDRRRIAASASARRLSPRLLEIPRHTPKTLASAPLFSIFFVQNDGIGFQCCDATIAKL
jgi:hypothetical protein